MTATVNLAAAVQAAASENKISCEAARGIAEKFGVAYKQVGDTANELGIKIKSCQLGCF